MTGARTATAVHRTRLLYGAVVAVLGVAAVVRFSQLGAQSFWVDEIGVTQVADSEGLLGAIRDLGPYEPPLSYVAVRVALHLPVGFETAARIPSAVFGIVEVGALMLVAREASRRWAVTLLAGSLLAVAPFAVRYGQEARYYTAFSAVALVTWWLLLRALRTGTRGWWIGYGVSVGVLWLTHPFTPIVVVFQAVAVAIVLVWRRRHGRMTAGVLWSFGRSVLLGVVVAAPWYLFGATAWLGSDTRYVINDPGTFRVVLDLDLYKRAAEWLLGNTGNVTVLVVLLALAALAAPWVSTRRLRWTAAGALAYALAFLTVLVPLANLGGTYVAFRRVELLVAPMVLAAAVAAVGLGDRVAALARRPALAVPVGAGVGAILLAVSAMATVDYYDGEKTNYRGLASAVADAPDDVTVVIGPVTPAWAPRIRRYLGFQDVGDQQVEVYRVGEPVASITQTGSSCTVLWITGVDPANSEFETTPLNDLSRLAPIAGDASLGEFVLPWYVSTSCAPDAEAFDRQRAVVSGLAPGITQQ